MHIFLGSVAKELFPRLCEEYLAGRLNLDKLITHRMSLDEINKEWGKVCKIVSLPVSYILV